MKQLSAFLTAALLVVSSACSSEPTSAAGATQPASAATPQPAGGTPPPNTSQAIAGQGGDEMLGTGTIADMAADFHQRCRNESKPSIPCEALHSLLVVRVASALEQAETSRDKRATTQALAALDLDDEPAIIVAAGRILGRFPDTPGLSAKMVPLMLDSPYVQVQRVAAQVLVAGPDEDLQNVGRLWLEGHNDLTANSPYQEYPDFPAHYAAMRFPAYAGAEWFSPLDSDRSIGWSTKDDAATVARWFGTALHADVLGAEQWAAVTNQQLMASSAAMMDPSKMTRLQQLMERVGKGDPAAAAELEKLQQEIEGTQKQVEEAANRSVTGAATVPLVSGAEARWIVVQKKGDRVSQVVQVYPIPGLKRTAVKFIWDLTDYPSAWPKTAR